MLIYIRVYCAIEVLRFKTPGPIYKGKHVYLLLQ